MKRYTDNLLVSFSGGETSAFMAQWLFRHYKELGYKDIAFVFANTGLEAEETLEFTDQCARHFGFDLHWIEAKISPIQGEGVRHNFVSFDTASRNGKPFEDGIQKHGIPLSLTAHCTRTLKIHPMKSFARVAFNGKKYDSAIGIRYDEIDRQNEQAAKERLVYPLIHLKTTKPIVNVYWRDMPFRLNIPSYLGNCVTCFKKGDKNLFAAIKERPEAMNFWVRVWDKYGNAKPETQTPFRKRRLPLEMIEAAKQWNGIARDARMNFSVQADLFEMLDASESCEVFSNCGDK